MSELRKRIFFIAGMHRSGTSFLTQALSFMGLDLPISIQPGAPDNPKGHFESFNIAQFHGRLLHEIGSSWDTFSPPPKSWFSSEYAEKSILKLSHMILSEFPGNGPILLKDPRISLFLPLWKDVVNRMKFDDFYIIPIRNPLDIAASLDKRNKISQDRALLIFLNYLFSAEKHSRGEKRSLVEFPQWTQEFKVTINKFESDLSTSFPNKNNNNIIEAQKEFEQDLVHHRHTLADTNRNDITKLCFNTYRSFLELTKNPSDTATLTKIDDYRHKFEELSAVFQEVFVE